DRVRAEARRRTADPHHHLRRDPLQPAGGGDRPCGRGPAVPRPPTPAHHPPQTYGIQSYISVPIVLSDGSFFGTLCSIDPRPAKLDNPQVRGMFDLFAQLIAFHIDAQENLAASHAALLDAREAGELRDQFIAVLGHDLRNPLASVDAGARLLRRTP